MKGISNILLGLAVLFFLASCNDTKKPADTLATGTIDISVDETYKPVIEEELKVFDSSYPEAHINIHYKPEAECYKDLFDKKARLILVTRPLTQNEKDYCEQKQIVPTSEVLAEDAVTAIVNNASADSMMGVNEIKGILTGVYKKKYTVVFDNEGSSTVRYITDSLLRGQPLAKNVYGAKGNQHVIDYVEKNPDAIGFLGLMHVNSSEDSSGGGSFIKNVKVVSIYNDSAKQYYQPYQAVIALKLYPFTRKLYYIKSENYPGLGTGFANFLTRERGQLIFAHAHLFPLKMNIVIRSAEINTDH
jgi:phosphate transport system substrate-binding protein